jgi:hypothetical protein
VHGTGAGMECGRRSGAGVVAGVLTGAHSAARLRAAGATHVVRGIADVPGLFEAPSPRVIRAAKTDNGTAANGTAGTGTAAAAIAVPPQAPAEHRRLGH